MSGHGDALARDFRVAVDRTELALRLDRSHGGDVERWAQCAGIEAAELLDFSASINPLGPPAPARRAFIESFADASRYPPPYGDQLKQALATRHGMSPQEILIGNGSTQLIYLLCAALRPRKALVVGPAFSEYANALALAGAQTRVLALVADDGFRFSTERFMAAWQKDCDMVFLTTPNSVTGGLIPRAEIAEIARAALARKSFVVVDEAFIDFVEAESIKTRVRENPYLIVLRSLTKYYSLPGLRLGYLFGAASTVAMGAAYQEPWSVNGPALKVALACLDDASFAIKTERWLEREREFLAKRLGAIDGIHLFPSQANFLLVKIEQPGVDALQLRSFLLMKKKILIRDCVSFAGLDARYFRVSVKRRAENKKLIAALLEWIATAA